MLLLRLQGGDLGLELARHVPVLARDSLGGRLAHLPELECRALARILDVLQPLSGCTHVTLGLDALGARVERSRRVMERLAVVRREAAGLWTEVRALVMPGHRAEA